MTSHAALVTYTGHFFEDKGYWRRKAREAGLPPDTICSACHDTGMVFRLNTYGDDIDPDVCTHCLSTWPKPKLFDDDEPNF